MVKGIVHFLDGHTEPVLSWTRYYHDEIYEFITESGEYWYDAGDEFEPDADGYLPVCQFYKLNGNMYEPTNEVSDVELYADEDGMIFVASH